MIIKDLRARLVLAQRSGALSGPGVEAHQLRVGPLIHMIHSQPATGIAQCGFQGTLRDVPTNQACQRVDELVAQGIHLIELPVVKVVAVPEVEPLHKITSIELYRGVKQGKTGGTNVGGRMIVG